MIRFACPGCSATFTVDDAKAGKQSKCPKCQAEFVIPAADPTAEAPPPLPRSKAPAADPNEPVEIDPCPKCGTRVTVMPGDLGSDVECPSCANVFTATKPGRKAPAPPPAPPKKTALESTDGDGRPRKSSSRRDDDEDDRPSKRRPRDDDEDDDDRPSSRRRRDDDDDEDDDRPRRNSRRRDDEDDDRPRRKAGRRRSGGGDASALQGPAIFMLVIGVLGILMAIVNIVVVAANLNNPGFNPNQGNKAAQYVGAGISLVWGLVVTLGGFNMKNTTNYTSCIVAAIFAIFPCNPCCVIGFIAGIWSLIVLLNVDVKAAFR